MMAVDLGKAAFDPCASVLRSSFFKKSPQGLSFIVHKAVSQQLCLFFFGPAVKKWRNFSLQ